MSLFPIYLVSFIGTLGFSIVLPFLITLVTKLGGNALVYGVVGATYSTFQLVGAPVLGRWSDAHGRRKILLLSQVGTLVSWVVFLAAFFAPRLAMVEVDSEILGAFTITAPLLVILTARALDGLTGGNVSVANAYLADLTEERDRNRNFGRMAVASNLGFILGPVLGGVLGATRLEEMLPVVAALAISLIATLVILFYLPESRPCVLRRSPEHRTVRKQFGQEQRDCFTLETSGKVLFTHVWNLPGIRYLLCLYFLIFLGFNLFYTSFPVHAVKSLQWSTRDIGLFFSVLGLVTVVVQGPLLARLSRVCSDRMLALLGSAILAAGFALFLSPRPAVIYSGALLFALGNGLMWPSFLAILSRASEERYQGAVQGYGGSVGSFASILGLILGGIAYEAIAGGTFMACAFLIALVFLFGFKLPGREPIG